MAGRRSDAPAQGAASVLSRLFATGRHRADTVHWLKENAELLGVFVAGKSVVDPTALATYARFYADIETRMTFFPQYYRFYLSIAMDCEDLGLAGTKSARLAQRAADAGLPAHELSDLQRAEAQRLLARRGIAAFCDDPGLADRMRRFCGQSAQFALPNRKAAYELTHAVFYLSDYGKTDPRLDAPVAQSLRYAGTIAYLDHDADLLAEICIAMRYAGLTPSALWEASVFAALAGMRCDVANPVAAGDDYHAFLMGNWALAAAGRAHFTRALPTVNFALRLAQPVSTPLRDLSAWLLQSGRLRSSDWQAARGNLLPRLGEGAAKTLREAELAIDDFAGFYAHFARADFWDCAA